VSFAIVLLIAQAQAQAGGWATARPAECASLDDGRGANVWERAKAPELRRYCDLLASGAAKLAGATSAAVAVQSMTAREVLGIADEADHAMPNRAGPSVLRGRALAKLGQWTLALAALRDAKTKDERALDDAQSLLAWGRVLARTGNAEEAREAYRALLPRASVLAPRERAAASVEAGLVAMGRGPSGLDEAVAILRQARRDAQDTTQTLAVMALSLALDRAGESDEARALLAERIHADPRPVLADARVQEILATAAAANESHAALGLALEALDPPSARAEWRAYVDGAGTGPWFSHATAHLSTSNGQRSPRRAPEKGTR
jgi:tetratricopeptide (TPR) repeat protein